MLRWIILLVEGFHLPRSWVAWLSGWMLDITLPRITSFRKSTPSAGFSATSRGAYEALASWFAITSQECNTWLR